MPLIPDNREESASQACILVAPINSNTKAEIKSPLEHEITISVNKNHNNKNPSLYSKEFKEQSLMFYNFNNSTRPD